MTGFARIWTTRGCSSAAIPIRGRYFATSNNPSRRSACAPSSTCVARSFAKPAIVYGILGLAIFVRLLGSITGYDGGATDFHLGPLTFALAYCDHVVVYRFAPRGLRLTDCEITWLVNEAAVEDRDYRLEDLVWLWDVTTIADKEIIERNQAGVDSRYYVPGPLSPAMETFTQQFLDWYVAVLRRITDGGLPGRRGLATIRSTAEGRK